MNDIGPYATVHELATALAAGTVTAAEIVDGCLSRIAALDDRLGAFVAVYPDEARAAAAAADRARRDGFALGPLHGIPVALKDLVELEGRITTGGSRHWDRRVSPVTATIARRFLGAGMVIVGKTHTVEFAMGGWGTNTHMGTPWNPWDTRVHRTPGGSSSGSGVAVAAGMVPAAIGTDTGGSVRLPASWCGIVGLKVTAGRISTHGVLPLSHTLDTPGPMTRSVEDAALLFDLLHGPDPGDPSTLPHPRTDALRGLKRGVRGLRLAAMPAAERAGVDADVLAAYDASLATLRGLGAEIVDLDLPMSFAETARATGRIIGSEGYSYVGELVDQDNLPIDPHVRPRIQLGRDVSARDYLHTLAQQRRDAAAFAAALEPVDALLTPTTATAAVPVDSVDQTGTPAVFTRAVNYLCACALSVPNGLTSDGLPTGLQIVCTPFAEPMALRIGWAFEQAGEHHRRHPPEM